MCSQSCMNSVKNHNLNVVLLPHQLLFGIMSISTFNKDVIGH